MTEDDRTVDCGLHGRQPFTFACTHIAHGLLDGTTPGFVIAPQESEALPLAWCDACEDFLLGREAGWDDEFSRRAEFKLLCAECYAEAKGVAICANRFRTVGWGHWT